MKHFLPSGIPLLDPRFVFQRGADSIYRAATYCPSLISIVRDALQPLCACGAIGLEPHSPASHRLGTPGRHTPEAPVQSPVTETPSHSISGGGGVFFALTGIAVVFATLWYNFFWIVKTEACQTQAPSSIRAEAAAASRDPFTTEASAPPEAAVVSGGPVPPHDSFQSELWGIAPAHLNAHAITPAPPPGRDQPPVPYPGRYLALVSEQRLASVGRISTRELQKSHVVRSIQIRLVAQVPAPVPFPIGNIQASHAGQPISCLPKLALTSLSLSDQSPPQAQPQFQQPTSLSHLGRLHALPLGSNHASFSYEDLAWHSLIGAGGFGTVYKAIVRENGQEVAVKCIPHSTKQGYEQILNEVELTQALGQSSWYAEFYGAFCTWDRVFIAMEFHSGGSLRDYIGHQGGRLHPRVAKFYAAELLVAISHAHALGIMHRDIKPDNILLDKAGHLTVIDMGLAMRFGMGDYGWTRGAYGTPGFMAPEMVLGELYDMRVDCFAWGVTLYYMLTGWLPPQFSRDDAGRFTQAGGPSYYNLENDTRIGYWECDLLSQVFVPELHRPTLSEVKKHPYWIGLDWEKIEKRLVSPPMAHGLGYPRLQHQLRRRR